MSAIVDWYTQRGQTPWLSVPDRLLTLPREVPPHLETVVMVRDLPMGEPDATVALAPRPDATWLALYERQMSVEVLTAVTDGDVVFAIAATPPSAARRSLPHRTELVGRVCRPCVLPTRGAEKAMPAPCALR